MRSHKGKPHRSTVLSILKLIPSGGVDAYTLATWLDRIGTHAGNGIQKQLGKLVKARLLTKSPSRTARGPGRPLMMYFLTPQSSSLLTLEYVREQIEALSNQLDLGDM